MPAKAEKRRYSGQTFEDRQSDRRTRLVEAALEVAGREGLEGASVAAICAQAGLTARYFYESFPSREEIFVEAYRLAQDRLLASIEAAKNKRDPAKSALKGFYTALLEHPGAARVFLVDIEDQSAPMRMATFEGGKKLAKAFGLKATHQLALVGIVGAIVIIGRRWIVSDYAEPVDKVVEIALPFTKIRM